MTEDVSPHEATPAVPDIDRYAVMADQGVILVGILNFIAGVAISLLVAGSTWHPGVDLAYRIASLTPGVFATLLFTVIGPRVWRRIVVDGAGFSIVKSALAGLLTVVVVHIVTIEVFLAVGFGLLWLFEPDFPYFDEFPGLVVMAPLKSLWVIGRYSLPAEVAISAGVALYCQNRLPAGDT